MKLRTTCIKTLVGLLCLLGLVCTSIAQADNKVNEQLAKRMELYQPELQKLGTRVHAVFGYEYSNYTYIEGDDGIIVVDTGWFPGQAKRSIDDYRNHVSKKPIVAVIYTHIHPDHTGGTAALLEGQSNEVAVYATAGWQNWLSQSFSNLRPAIFKRIYQQMGLLLPRGEDGTVGNGLNPSPMPDGAPGPLEPTHPISEDTEITISGVRIRLIPQQGDLPDHLYIWLPDDGVLMVGDIPLHATFPALETVRFEAERDPRAHLDSLDKIIELDPEYVIPGHGRVLVGKDEVKDVTLANRDVVEFLIDQIDRYYVKGYSADQIIDEMKLPPYLAEHPDLQPFYHRVEWMVKTMYFKRAGFVGESMDFVTLTNNQEAKRLVPLLGGKASVLKMAQDAMDSADPRWAARLATFVLEVDAGDKQALKIRQSAFTKIAQTTESANERNYLFSIIKEENGEIDWKSIFANGDHELIKNQNTKTVLKLMKSRFRAEAADGFESLVKLTVGSSEQFYFRVRNNVLILSENEVDKVDASLNLSRDTLNEIAANLSTWQKELEAGKLNAAGELSKVRKLVTLIE